MRVCPRCGSIYQLDPGHCGIDGSPLIEQEGDPLVGRTLDRYQIEAKLGEGGMGHVYRARHVTLGRSFAVKVIYGDMASNKLVAERFRREATAAGGIIHRNVVAVTDFGTTESGLMFMVMELVHGPTLAQVLTAGRITPLRAAHIARQIAAALTEAHRIGFVHRDLKPSNVMLVAEAAGEEVKVLDFGIVGMRQEPGTKERLTGSGMLLGTPLYMAPEQIFGAQPAPSLDLYALGVILYEMLAGAPPFTSEAVATVLSSHISKAPAPLVGQTGMEDLVMRLLQKDPASRPASAQEVVEALDQVIPVLESTKLIAPLTTGARAVPVARRKTWPFWVGLAMTGSAAAIALAVTVKSRSHIEDAGPGVPIAVPTTTAPMRVAGTWPENPRDAGLREPPALAPPEQPWPDLTQPAKPVIRPRAPAHARPAVPHERPPSDLDARLAELLRARGWTLEDLQAAPATRPAARNWLDRRGDAGGDRAEEAFLALVARVEELRASDVLAARIERLRRRLDRSESRLPAEAYRAMEDRFLDLETERTPGLDDGAVRKLLERAAQLERDLSAANLRP